MFRPLWIEINLAKLGKNFQIIKNIVGKEVKILASLKQEAYGHGLLPVAQKLIKLGIDFLGLGDLEEGISLREKKITTPILIFTVMSSNQAKYFVEYKITPTVVDLEFANQLNKQAKKRKEVFPIHIKIDTGMGRIGHWYKQAYRFVEEITKFKNLTIEGIYTHLSSADTDEKFTLHQIKIFHQFLHNLREKGVSFNYTHCANSAGLVKYPQSHFNLVRPGLILYGINPLTQFCVEVEPVLSLKSKIIFIKKVEKGRPIGYGRTHITKRATKIATVAIGYADGYPWALSNKARVLIKGEYFNLVGRVCMDHIMVDIGNREDIKVGEEVVLIGSSGNLKITAEQVANWANTISYEIVSKLSLKIPRRIVKN